MLTGTSTTELDNFSETSASTDVGPELLRMALDGDGQAWARLVQTYSPFMRRIAFRYRIGDEANDAVQTTFLHLLEHGDRIRNPEALKGWLRTTLINECLRVVRRARRERMNSDDSADANAIPLPSDEYPDTRVVRREEITLLRSAVANLPARDRDLMVLLNDPEVDGYRSVSELLGMPVGSIGPTRGRILVRLRESLRSVGLEDCA
jgi:RNA polymerase sigma factor (sigma-70 family)